MGVYNKQCGEQKVQLEWKFLTATVITDKVQLGSKFLMATVITDKFSCDQSFQQQQQSQQLDQNPFGN